MSYNVKDMQQFAFQVMCQAGLSEEESAVFSDSLVKADMRGISSHGMTRLATYAKRVEDGLVAGHVTPEIIKDGLGVIAVDGKNGMGAYVGAWTMERCMERAEKYGNCFAAVRGGNHFGYAAYFTELAARGGMLGLAIANGPPGMPFRLSLIFCAVAFWVPAMGKQWAVSMISRAPRTAVFVLRPLI